MPGLQGHLAPSRAAAACLELVAALRMWTHPVRLQVVYWLAIAVVVLFTLGLWMG